MTGTPQGSPRVPSRFTTMTPDQCLSLIDQPPGMRPKAIEAALSISEHGRRQLEADGLLVPLEVGRRKLYPRWQVFALLGMVDPDVAAADAAREGALRNAETPTITVDVPDIVAPLESPRIEVAHASV